MKIYSFANLGNFVVVGKKCHIVWKIQISISEVNRVPFFNNFNIVWDPYLMS
jgi:hypothetical protein